MSKRALITGGNGYIGHHLQKELKKNGYTVIVVDRKPVEDLMSDKYCDLYWQHDLTKEPERVPAIKVDVVFHLAGLIEVATGEKEPINYYYNNICATINTLKLMKNYFNCDRVVFSSSAGVYGDSVYGRTKKMSELIYSDAYKEGIKSVSLRYFNVAGADIDNEFGENHSPETHLIPNILNSDIFNLYGMDYDTHDGTCIRDYIHVSDLAISHIKADEYLIENNVAENFDIGSGTGYSILEVLKEIEKVTNREYVTVVQSRRPGDPDVLRCDTTRAEQLLKFKPKYNLNDIIRTSYQWEVIQKRECKI
jgi:UDP-glucose 4-epimerase